MDKDRKPLKMLYFAIPVIILVVIAMFFIFSKKEESYSVSFVLEDGTVLSDQTIDSSGNVTRPEDPTKEGYVFEGWYSGGVKFDFNTEVKKDMVLEARWSAKEVEKDEEYSVSFDSNGGNTISSKSIKKGEKVTKPQDPTKTGYTFVSWQLNGGNYDFNSPVTKNIVLVAKWNKVDDVQTEQTNTFTVKFNSDGGTSIKSQTIEKGEKVTKPKDPTKKGYTFKGWLLSKKSYDFNLVVTKDITLIASWEKIDVYSVKQSAFLDYSPQIKVTVYKNGKAVGASAVLSSKGSTLGIYNSEYNTILIDATEYSKIAQAKLNDGTIVNITSK